MSLQAYRSIREALFEEEPIISLRDRSMRTTETLILRKEFIKEIMQKPLTKADHLQITNLLAQFEFSHGQHQQQLKLHTEHSLNSIHEDLITIQANINHQVTTAQTNISNRIEHLQTRQDQIKKSITNRTNQIEANLKTEMEKLKNQLKIVVNERSVHQTNLHKLRQIKTECQAMVNKETAKRKTADIAVCQLLAQAYTSAAKLAKRHKQPLAYKHK